MVVELRIWVVFFNTANNQCSMNPVNLQRNITKKMAQVIQYCKFPYLLMTSMRMIEVSSFVSSIETVAELLAERDGALS